MWYVLVPTGLAFTGIGNATVKRGTLANEGAATAGTSPSTAAPGNASIPAPTAPLKRNCCLLIRLFVMACPSRPLDPQNGKPATAAVREPVAPLDRPIPGARDRGIGL